MFRQTGVDYFNPDEAARRIRAATRGMSMHDANAAAWKEGKRLLERAVSEGLTYAFETTLGGRTIANLLKAAASLGIEVRIWFVGLKTPDLHIARVHARVASGGHDIPDQIIRERYDRSRLNLIDLLPCVTELRVFDNSVEADPVKGNVPAPMLVLHMIRGSIATTCGLAQVPQWAKPIVAAALANQ